jgi:homoserine dehydrogenase
MRAEAESQVSVGSGIGPWVEQSRTALPILKVAIVGYGTVGRSVAKILCERTPERLVLTHVCNRNLKRKKLSDLPSSVALTESYEDVLASDADIVVELIGGIKPAYEWVKRALEAGKSVVTANKQLIARHGIELAEVAKAHGVQLQFGASVAGGIPIIRGLEEGLCGDRIFRVCGVLNGTCNYILTRMQDGEVTFATALAEAQQKGFAEADPTDDVDGFDPRAKLAILARIALNCEPSPDEIMTQSIRGIDAVDFHYAKDLGCTIRQVSYAEIKGDVLAASVQPALVAPSSPLARVQGSQNLVIAAGEYGGETVFSGHGAGGDPTAVAVVSDLIAVAESRENPAGRRSGNPAIIKVTGDFEAEHYVRFTVKDRPGIIAALAGIFAQHSINIDAVVQKPGYPKDRLPFVITLEPCKTSVLDHALEEIKKLDFLVESPLSMPILFQEKYV